MTINGEFKSTHSPISGPGVSIPDMILPFSLRAPASLHGSAKHPFLRRDSGYRRVHGSALSREGQELPLASEVEFDYRCRSPER